MFVSERHPYNCKLCNNQSLLYEKKLKTITGLSTPHILKYWVMMHSTWRHLFCTKILIDSNRHKCLPWHKVHKKDVVGIVAFDLIGLLPTNHIIAYIKNVIIIPEFMRKCSNLISSLESRVYKKRQTLAIVWEISYSNLETGRYCLKSGVSQTIRKSWQHCHGWAVKGNSVINSYFYYEQICKKYPLFKIKIKPFHSKNVIPNR